MGYQQLYDWELWNKPRRVMDPDLMHTGKLKTYTGHCTKLGENWREKRMGQWQWMMAAPWFSDGDDASLVMLCWANRWKPRQKMLVMFHYAFLPVALEGLMFLALTAEGESFLRNTFGETHQSIHNGLFCKFWNPFI